MRYARIPAKPQRSWSELLADGAAAATLFIGGAIFYQLACPLDAYAATVGADICMSGAAQTAMTVIQVGGGIFIGIILMTVLYIARDKELRTPARDAPYGSAAASFHDGMVDADYEFPAEPAIAAATDALKRAEAAFGFPSSAADAPSIADQNRRKP